MIYLNFQHNLLSFGIVRGAHIKGARCELNVSFVSSEACYGHRRNILVRSDSQNCNRDPAWFNSCSTKKPQPSVFGIKAKRSFFYQESRYSWPGFHECQGISMWLSCFLYANIPWATKLVHWWVPVSIVGRSKPNSTTHCKYNHYWSFKLAKVLYSFPFGYFCNVQLIKETHWIRCYHWNNFFTFPNAHTKTVNEPRTPKRREGKVPGKWKELKEAYVIAL